MLQSYGSLIWECGGSYRFPSELQVQVALRSPHTSWYIWIGAGSRKFPRSSPSAQERRDAVSQRHQLWVDTSWWDIAFWVMRTPEWKNPKLPKHLHLQAVDHWWWRSWLSKLSLFFPVWKREQDVFPALLQFLPVVHQDHKNTQRLFKVKVSSLNIAALPHLHLNTSDEIRQHGGGGD